MNETDDSIDEASAAAVEFTRHMEELRASVDTAGRGVDGLSRGLSRGLKGALDSVVFEGASASAALEMVGRSLLDSVYNAAVTPVTKHLGGLLSGAVGGLMPFASGGAFSQGQVRPFADGGIVSAPTTFPMKNGTGLMGEAGPEAIMPLARGPDGRLGVAGGGGGTSVTINVTTPDVEGFRRSRSQIAAEMGRALSRGSRNR